MPAALLVALGLAVTLAPLALSWAAGLPPRPFLDELSSGLAMAGLALLLTEFALSGRFRAISGRVGMDVTMRMHQLLARSALAFVLLHPMLYTLPLLENPPPWDTSAATHLRLDARSIATGLLAWLGLGALVITAVARDQLDLRYERWRLAHGLGAAAVAGLALDHALRAGRYAALPALEAFWIAMAALAAASLLWVYALAPALRLARPFEVASVRRVADRTWELVVRPRRRPQWGALRFRAGQFVWLRMARTPFGVGDNPFSIASAPAPDGAMGFLIREAGDFTRAVGAARAGDPVWIDGPFGALAPPPRAQRIGLIGGGVGVAPLLSILREMRACGDPRPVALLYGERDARRLAYLEELRALGRAEGVEVFVALSHPPEGWDGLSGVIDAAAIDRAFPGAQGAGARAWGFAICGPPPMMDAAERALLARGVPASAIRLERFDYG